MNAQLRRWELGVHWALRSCGVAELTAESPMTVPLATARGGSWLIDEATDVFTREQLNDEQQLILRTAEAFIDNDVIPKLDQLEAKDWALARTLVQRAAELGLLAT